MHPDKMPGLIPNQKKDREREKILVIAGSFCQTVAQMEKKKKNTEYEKNQKEFKWSLMIVKEIKILRHLQFNDINNYKNAKKNYENANIIFAGKQA